MTAKPKTGSPLIRKSVALSMLADEMHEEVHEVIAKMQAMTGGAPMGAGK